MAYPQRLLSPDEVVVREFRPHWSRILTEIVLSVAVVIVLVLVATLFDFGAEAWVLGAIALIWLVLVARGLLAWWFTQHVITNERVIYRAGILSRQGKEIPLEVINDVSFQQSAWERLIGSGHLLIESAGEMGQSHYRDITQPEEMQTVIYQVREERMMQLERADTGGTISRSQQLEILARLHDEGKLTDDEYTAEKRTLGEGTV